VSNAGGLASLAGLVPSIYYDLIARVASGAALISVLSWTPDHSIRANVSFSSLTLLLGAGYIVGLVLTPVASVISSLVAWCLRTKLELPGDSSFLATSTMIAARNDQVAMRNAEAGVTLAKMQAESTLCCNLFAAFILLVVVNAAVVDVPAIQRLTCSSGILLGTFLLPAACFREVAYLLRQNALHKLYVRE